MKLSTLKIYTFPLLFLYCLLSGCSFIPISGITYGFKPYIYNYDVTDLESNKEVSINDERFKSFTRLSFPNIPRPDIKVFHLSAVDKTLDWEEKKEGKSSYLQTSLSIPKHGYITGDIDALNISTSIFGIKLEVVERLTCIPSKEKGRYCVRGENRLPKEELEREGPHSISKITIYDTNPSSYNPLSWTFFYILRDFNLARETVAISIKHDSVNYTGTLSFSTIWGVTHSRAMHL